MNNEKMKQIIDEAYRKYADSHNYFVNGCLHVIPMVHNKKTFINECKTNPEFSKKWGLRIEERELSLDERNKWSWDNWGVACEMESVLDEEEVPKRVITITYNNKKTEIYES